MSQTIAASHKPRVLIVGAGLGGLTLALLLLKGGIPFLIVERAKEVRPLGKVDPYRTQANRKSLSNTPVFFLNF